MSGMISPFQMSKNQIVSFEFKQNACVNEYKSQKVSFGADYEMSDVTESEGKMSAELHLLIEIIGKADIGEELFQIRLDMMGEFEGLSEQLDKERFLSMLKINGLSTLMQLSRAYVTASTALCGFTSPIHFPMVNVYELVKRKENKL